MKKLYLLLICILVTVCLAACGNEEEPESGSKKKKTPTPSSSQDATPGAKDDKKDPFGSDDPATPTDKPADNPGTGDAGTKKVKDAKPGDVVVLGSYEQDNNPANGKEPVEWIVLDEKDGKLLLISRYIIDVRPQINKYMSIVWESSALRSWLNNYFVDECFNEAEKAIIPVTTVVNEDNPVYSTAGGNPTEDRLFVLSYSEAKKYFPTNASARSTLTEYANSIQSVIKKSGAWWLRTPGQNKDRMCYVAGDGGASKEGWSPEMDNCGVRPVMWVVK